MENILEFCVKPIFYSFLLATYGIWGKYLPIGLVAGKLKKNYCWFSRFSTFYGKKTWFDRYKIFRLLRAVAVAVRKNLYHTYSHPLQARKLEFWLP
jgi:hypothetical protein